MPIVPNYLSTLSQVTPFAFSSIAPNPAEGSTVEHSNSGSFRVLLRAADDSLQRNGGPGQEYGVGTCFIGRDKKIFVFLYVPGYGIPLLHVILAGAGRVSTSAGKGYTNRHSQRLQSCEHMGNEQMVGTWRQQREGGAQAGGAELGGSKRFACLRAGACSLLCSARSRHERRIIRILAVT